MFTALSMSLLTVAMARINENTNMNTSKFCYWSSGCCFGMFIVMLIMDLIG